MTDSNSIVIHRSAVLVSRVILKGKGIGNSLFSRNPILFTFLFSFFSYLNNRLSPSTGWKIRENGGAVVSICIIRGWFLFLCICIINKFLARAFGHNFSTAASPFHFVSLRLLIVVFLYLFYKLHKLMKHEGGTGALFAALSVRPTALGSFFGRVLFGHSSFSLLIKKQWRCLCLR